MHYVRARWMNPQFGNWMSVDPRLDQFAYQYANNMPTTATDPSGKDVYEHLSDHDLEWSTHQGWLPDSVKHAAAEELRRRHPSAPPHAPQDKRGAQAGVPAPHSGGTAERQQSHTPPPPKAGTPPAGPHHGPSPVTHPPDPHRMAGKAPLDPGTPTHASRDRR